MKNVPPSSAPVLHHDECTIPEESPANGNTIEKPEAPGTSNAPSVLKRITQFKKTFLVGVGAITLGVVLSQLPKKDDAPVEPDLPSGKAGQVSTPEALKAPERAPDSKVPEKATRPGGNLSTAPAPTSEVSGEGSVVGNPGIGALPSTPPTAPKDKMRPLQ